MSILSNIGSFLGANKLAIIFGATLIAGGWFALHKVESLSKEVTELSNIAEQQQKEISAIREQYKENQRVSSIYYTNTNKNIANMNDKLAQLDKAATREATVAKKPGLVTKIAKDQVSEYQDRLACASGNQQSCLRLQQQSQPAKPSQK